MDWKEKTIDKVIWRGSFTGAFHSDAFDWPNSQRERMVKLASSREDRLQELLVQGWKRVDRKRYSVAELNERFLDIAPVGGPVQVSPLSGFHRKKSIERIYTDSF
jgi:hypothetical protein